MNMMNDLYEMCEILSKELTEVKNRARQGGLNSSMMDYIDKLTHSIKSIKTTIAMEESGMSYRDGGYNRYYANPNTYGEYNRGYHDDGMGGGEYNRRGYNEGGSFAQEIQRLIGKAPTPQMRMEMEHLAQKANNAM